MSAPVWLCTFLGLLALIVMFTVAGLGNGSWSRLPLNASQRRRLTNRSGLLRLVSAVSWTVAWTTAMVWVTPLPEQRVMALLVGLFLGAVIAVFADTLIRRTLDIWATDVQGLPSPTPPPRRGMVRRSSEANPLVLHPRLAELSRGYRPSERLERLSRWTRNVLAVLIVFLVVALRLAQPLGHEDDWILPLSGAFAALVAALCLVVVVQRRRRRAQDRRAHHLEAIDLRTLLTEHAWRFVQPTTTDLRPRFPGHGLLPPRTEMHRVRHRIEGVADGFAFWFVAEEGAASSVRQKVMEDRARCVTLMPIPGQLAPLPQLTVTGRESRYVIEQRINHTLELEEFNRRFHVSSADASSTTAFLTPRMMEHLIQELPDGGTLSVCGDAVSLHMPEPMRVWRLEHQLSFLAGVVKLLPTYLRA